MGIRYDENISRFMNSEDMGHGQSQIIRLYRIVYFPIKANGHPLIRIK
jgi:hypothetical protein